MNKHTKILAAILLGLFITYNLFGLNKLAVIFCAIALCIGYGLLLASMKIWQKRIIRKYHKKHKTIPKTYEDLEKHLKGFISLTPHLKKKLILPNVTLLSVTSVKIILGILALGIFLNVFSTPIAVELFGIKDALADW